MSGNLATALASSNPATALNVYGGKNAASVVQNVFDGTFYGPGFSREQVLETARIVKDAGAAMFRGGAYKPRTSPYAFQGLGEEGLRYLADAREETGLGIVADTGNFWMERDLRATLLAAAPHIDLVQLTDVSIGTVHSAGDAPSGGRVPFGEGDLPIARLLRDIKDTGYAGPFELELIGPLGDSEGYAPVIRRGVAAAAAMLGQTGL